ncbi:MAG: putative toxin-antitoxin system toxin component, PIN family [Thermoguttaceae bacterium]|jgi:putative PIN family toxin of toxin-antitoxin system
MRAVLDTNILARAAASPFGPAGELFERISTGHTLLVSSELLDELSGVLGRDWVRRVNRRSETDIAEFVGSIEAGGRLISLPKPVPRVVPGDPDDDLIVAVAVAGRADVICTLDHHFYENQVQDYCRARMIEIMDDVELLVRLRKA